MKLLVTGGLGNIGRVVVNHALSRGHEVSIFEADTPPNRKRAARWRDRAKIILADIRDRAAVRGAVARHEAVIHMAAMLPPASERNPELTREVNVEGTSHLIDAIR